MICFSLHPFEVNYNIIGNPESPIFATLHNDNVRIRMFKQIMQIFFVKNIFHLKMQNEQFYLLLATI